VRRSRPAALLALGFLLPVLLPGCRDDPAGPVLERDLTIIAAEGRAPSLSGGRVAWESSARGREGEIVVGRVDGGVEARFPGSRTSADPALGGERVAWTAVVEVTGPDGETDHVFTVKTADLLTGETRTLTDPRSGEHGLGPAVGGDGDWVAFRFGTRPRGGDGSGTLGFVGVLAVNVRTGEERLLAEDFALSSRVRGDGRRVVWSGRPFRSREPSQVWVHDFAARRTERVSPAGNHEDPDISGRRVVWSGRTETTEGAEGAEGTGADIFLLDLETGELRNLTPDRLIEFRPSIDGDRVAWVEGGGFGNRDLQEIGTLDLATGERRRLTRDAVPQDRPDVSGDLVSWEERGRGGYRVVMADLR